VSPKNFDTFFFPKYHIFYFSRAPRSRALKFFLNIFKYSSKIPPGDAAAATSIHAATAAPAASSSSQQQREIIQVYMYTQIFD
jgi:hypothetical protein